MTAKPYSNNEFNFGGTNASSTIYFGYRATDSKPIPTKFVFGGSAGSANLTAASATLSGAISAGSGAITTLTSNTGTITTIKAQDALVSGKLRATTYDLQVAQNQGGMLTVAPTLRIESGITVNSLSISSGTISLQITHSSITSDSIGGITWATGHRVKVSANINGRPSGTLDGTITAFNAANHTITVSASGGDAANLTTASPNVVTDLAIMVYERKDGSNYYPVGIQINCYDQANDAPTIRVYGGTSSTPTVFLGNFVNAGLPAINGVTPGTETNKAWGLYTDTGYFTGTVVSESGKIGGWTLGTNSIYSGNATPGASASTMVISTGTASTNNIGGGGTSSKTWMLSAGTGFGVTTSGALYSNSGYIAGWKIETNDLVNGTWGSANSVMLCTGSSTAKSIGGSESTVNGWVITAGANFGVTKTGDLYANSAHISGAITASSLTINSGASISGTIPQANITNLTNDLASASTTATAYITDIDTNKGIIIKPRDASGNDFLQLSSDAISMYRNNVETLQLTDSMIRVGKIGDNKRNLLITDYGVKIRNNTKTMAEYGSSIYLYRPNTSAPVVTINNSGAVFDGTINAAGGSIGGFIIDETSLHSIGKTSYNSTDKGLYFQSALEITTVTLSSEMLIGLFAQAYDESGSDWVFEYVFDKEPRVKTSGALDSAYLTINFPTAIQTLIDNNMASYGMSLVDTISAGETVNKSGTITGTYTNNTTHTQYIVRLTIHSDEYTNKDTTGAVVEYATTTTLDAKFAIGASNGNHLIYDGTSLDISGAINATSFSAKSYEGSTLKRQMSLGADGLKLMDGSGTILSQLDGSAATIGKTSGNNYNINITNSAIDLRYNTNVLNRIDSTGMVLYDGSGLADSNKIASFGSTVTIGKQNVSQLVLSSGSIEGIGQNGLSYFMVNNDGANSVTFEYAKNYGPYTIAGGNDRSVSISTTTSSLSSGTYFEIKTVVNNANRTVRFKKGTASTRILYGTVIEGAYDGANTIVITNNATGSRSVHIYTYIEVIGAKTVAYQFGEAKENVEFGAYAFLSGANTEASGNYTHVEGHSTTANGDYAHAEGYSTTASGYASHAEGESTTVAINTFYGHAEGTNTVVSGIYAAHAEGMNTTASDNCAHAEGINSEASGYASHAEGSSGASGKYAHAEGASTSASGGVAHSEGRYTIASGYYSHAEGSYTMAEGEGSHTEGESTIARGEGSHAGGFSTAASGAFSCALGIRNKEDDNCYVKTSDTSISRIKTYYVYHPDGYYNKVSNPTIDNINNYYEHFGNRGKYCVIIGNGELASSECSNALTVDWNGNVIGQAMAGIIQMYAGANANIPSGWLLCDGSEVSIADYPTLNDALGGDSANSVAATTWGTASQTGYFKLPDLRGRAPIGAGTGSGLTARTLGGSIGSENIQAHTHDFTQPKTPNHTHTMTYVGDAASNISGTNPSNLGSVVRRTTSSSDTTNWTSNSTGGGVACTGGAVGAVSGASTGNAGNMQPSAVVNFIICTGKTS